MTAWIRKGVVLAADGAHPWWRTAAGIPTCLPMHERLWRIWFGGRDAQGRSGVLCADVDPSDDMRVLALRETPGLERGPEGAFDSAGLWASAALAIDDRVMLWYTGMQLGRGGLPHELAIGLAVSEDGGLTFRKASQAPVLASPPGLPPFATTPCVVRETDGFTMWYSRGSEWRDVGGKLEPFYDLHCAWSADGFAWTPCEDPVLALSGTGWAGLTRPWVEHGAAGSTLWFSARGSTSFRQPSDDAYRLHVAQLDGRRCRPDSIRPVRFSPSPESGDWDDWMQVACCVVPRADGRVMFYNGNGFSRTGFGWAVAQAPVSGGRA